MLNNTSKKENEEAEVKSAVEEEVKSEAEAEATEEKAEVAEEKAEATAEEENAEAEDEKTETTEEVKTEVEEKVEQSEEMTETSEEEIATEDKADEDKADDKQTNTSEQSESNEKSASSKEEKKEKKRTPKSAPVAEPKKEVAPKKTQKKLRYTVLMVPNNDHRVRQFHISFDFLLFLMSIFILCVVILAYCFISSTLRIQSLEKQVEDTKSQYDVVSDQNILLQANIEELEKSLREAKVSLDVSKNIQQQEEEKHTQSLIPNAFPTDVSSGLPSEFTPENGYVEFNTGYGTKILATADGTVSSVEEGTEHGYAITVDHGNGYETVYMSPSLPNVSEGDKVITGSTLSVIEGDGQVLAYQIKFNGKAIDPLTVIDIDG